VPAASAVRQQNINITDMLKEAYVVRVAGAHVGVAGGYGGGYQ
jgi:hypothetical protein